MEYVPGDDLHTLWNRQLLTSDQKQSIVRGVAGYVEQLRSIETPKEMAVSSARLNPFKDHRVDCVPFGPFLTHDEFHCLLRGGMPLEDCAEYFGEVMESHSKTYSTHFTHADLCPRNIILRDGKVAAIIDRECAGFYPEY